MPWDQIAPHAPALVALILLVAMAGALFWRIWASTREQTSEFLRTLAEVGAACHTNHREIAERAAQAIRESSSQTARAIESNTQALGDCHSCQRETVDAMKEMTFALRQINGRSHSS